MTSTGHRVFNIPFHACHSSHTYFVHHWLQLCVRHFFSLEGSKGNGKSFSTSCESERFLDSIICSTPSADKHVEQHGNGANKVHCKDVAFYLETLLCSLLLHSTTTMRSPTFIVAFILTPLLRSTLVTGLTNLNNHPFSKSSFLDSTYLSAVPSSSSTSSSSASSSPGHGGPRGPRSAFSKNTARESAVNVEWEPMTELERRIEDGVNYEHIPSQRKQAYHHRHHRQHHVADGGQGQVDNDGIPTARGVFCGYRFTQEEYNRLKSANVD